MIAKVSLTKKYWDNIDKTNTAWSDFSTFSLALTQAEELTNSAPINIVEELVKRLAQAPKIKKVRAVALRFPDIHWIDFELELQPETELSHEEWENLQNLVIDYEWKLRDNSGEKWYFHAEPVNKFSQLRDGSRVISNSEDRQPQVIDKQISSSNLTFNFELTASKNSFTQQ